MYASLEAHTRNLASEVCFLEYIEVMIPLRWDFTKINTMKNILIVSAVFDPEPLTTAQMNYDLALKLSDKYNVTVLRPHPTRPIGRDYGEYNINYPFTCVTLESYTYPESKLVGRMRESISFGKQCCRYILKNRKNIDFVYNASWQIFGLNIVARTCVKCNIPYMLPIQDIYPESLFTHTKYPRILQSVVTFLLLNVDKYTQRNAYRVRTITSEMADYLSTTRNVPREKYLVVNNWQNDTDIFYENMVGSESIVFSYVGSINSHSNVELIIRAFHEAGIKNSQLKIYGGGSHLETCIKLAKELKANNIMFDYVSKDKIPLVQSQSTVLVLALPRGNGLLCLPSKISSYMFSGRPLLVSVDSDSATARYIKEAQCGISVLPDCKSSIVNGFKYFESIPIEQLNYMGYNGRKYAERELTREQNLSMVCKDIDSLLSS